MNVSNIALSHSLCVCVCLCQRLCRVDRETQLRLHRQPDSDFFALLLIFCPIRSDLLPINWAKDQNWAACVNTAKLCVSQSVCTHVPLSQGISPLL